MAPDVRVLGCAEDRKAFSESKVGGYHRLVLGPVRWWAWSVGLLERMPRAASWR